MDEIGKFDGVLNEEHWDVVANEVPVSLLCIEFHGEAAYVARRVHRSGAARYRRNAGEQRRLFARALEQVGLCDIGQRFEILKITVRGRTARVHDTFRNSLVVKVEYFFPQDKIFEQGRAARARAQRILVIRDANALIGREMGIFFRVGPLLGDLLVGLAARADHRLKIFVFCHAACPLALEIVAPAASAAPPVLADQSGHPCLSGACFGCTDQAAGSSSLSASATAAVACTLPGVWWAGA